MRERERGKNEYEVRVVKMYSFFLYGRFRSDS